MFRFEWDPKKEISNYKKHGVSFDDAMTAFDDIRVQRIFDHRHSSIEIRERLIGKSDIGVLVIVFTMRDRWKIRLISARQANKKERKVYEEGRGFSL